MRHTVKERDLAGMAAFELALQYLLIRQDRSYHFAQLLIAIFTLVFLAELLLMACVSVVLPMVPPSVPEHWFAWMYDLYSPLVAVVALLVLLVTRACKTRFVIEPGEQTIDRLNRDLLEPCLGMKFDVETGKLFSDHRREGDGGLETFYTLRYSSDTSSRPAAGAPAVSPTTDGQAPQLPAAGDAAGDRVSATTAES